MVDTEGKILIGENGLIKEAADGHGGIYEALVKNGMTKKMRELGVEWIFIGGVDNCLVKMVDPILMGIAIQKNVTAAGKSVVKANPQEVCICQLMLIMPVQYQHCSQDLIIRLVEHRCHMALILQLIIQ